MNGAMFHPSLSAASPRKVMHGAGMKTISSKRLTKCVSEKGLESVGEKT